MMTLLRRIAALLFIAMAAADAHAQTNQAKVRGTVRDQTSAFVGGAKVTATNERTG
jgi:hypothetical protein